MFPKLQPPLHFHILYLVLKLVLNMQVRMDVVLKPNIGLILVLLDLIPTLQQGHLCGYLIE